MYMYEYTLHECGQLESIHDTVTVNVCTHGHVGMCVQCSTKHTPPYIDTMY